MVPGQVTWRQGAGLARRAGRGFTLVELLIVIGIMAVLLIIALPSGIAMRRQSRRATCAANLKAIGQALLLFREDYQCFPPDRDEYLWTEEAHDRYVAQYGVEPPNYDPTSLTAAAYDPYGNPFPTQVVDPRTNQPYPLHGLGLYTLYVLGSYSSVLPPPESDPRFTAEALANAGRTDVKTNQGFNQRALDWFKGAGYITERDTFHCPENMDTDLEKSALVQRWRMPLLTTTAEVSVYNDADQQWETVEQEISWNNYDLFYHRNQWNPGYKPEAKPDPRQGERHLLQPYPPSDTVVTWCAYHRKDTRRRAAGGQRPHVGPHQPDGPPGPGPHQPQGPTATEARDFNRVSPGDQDLVLFADGSVRRLTSRADNKTYEAPPGDRGWPQGPLM